MRADRIVARTTLEYYPGNIDVAVNIRSRQYTVIILAIQPGSFVERQNVNFVGEVDSRAIVALHSKSAIMFIKSMKV